MKILHPILQHPWYQKWECGELPHASLQTYAREYYAQVAHFPRYLSRLHSQLADLGARQVVLANLADEEALGTESATAAVTGKPKPHPELWLDFAESLGCDRQAVAGAQPGPAAAELVREFSALVAEGPAQGLGAILAYESQVPQVARFKGAALRQHYLAPDQAEAGTRFFDVHAQADEWHTQALEGVVAKLSASDQTVAQASADRASLALWKFLDAMPN